MKKLNNLLYYSYKFFSYIPLVMLPMLVGKKYGDIKIIALVMLIWKLITYNMFPLLAHIFLLKGTKCILAFGSALVWIIFNDIYIKIILTILLICIVGQYLAISNVCVNRKIERICIIMGMLSTGGGFINLYFWGICCEIFFLLFLFFSDFLKSQMERKKELNRKVSNKLLVIAFLHNMHYYLYAVVLPLLINKISKNILLIGIPIAVSWLLFFENDKILCFARRILDLKKILCLSFFVLSILLAMLYKTNNFVIFTFLFLLQGIFAGVSEEFFSMEEVKNNIFFVKKIWKIGGCIGIIGGGIIGELMGVHANLLIAAYLAFLAAVITSQLEEKADDY